jgi:hypothetical protein
MPEKDEVTKDYDTVVAQAKRLNLTGADKDDYIHKHMRGYGYKSKRSYFKPKSEGSSGGGFFGRSTDDDDDDDDE